MRSSAKRYERNRRYRSAARTYVKKTRELIKAGDFDEAEQALNQACSTLDKAARKGVLHGRNAARRKGRLMAALAKARAAAQ
jgi:small subunit ribosomal protein S20